MTRAHLARTCPFNPLLSVVILLLAACTTTPTAMPLSEPSLG